MCNSKRVMSDRRNSNGGRRPLEFVIFCPFWSNDLFPVAAVYITAKFHSYMSIDGRNIAVCAKIQDCCRRHLGLNFCLMFWYTCMWDLQSNTRAKFRANMCHSIRDISNRWNLKWRPPPSWIYYFCPFWSNGQMVYYRWLSATLLQNFI